jgi:hypothetical protein
MAKNKNEDNDTSSDRQRQLDLISRGESIEGGWCLDFDHPDVVYRCSDEEEAVAKGEVSMSFNRDKVLDLKTGDMVEREPDFRRPVNFLPVAGDVPAATGGATGGTVTGNTGGTSSGGA